MEQIIEAVDAYRTEEGNLAYMQRQIAREKAKADAYVAKRKEENATRTAAGLAPLPEEDVSRLFKIPPEPSRLESMLLLGRIDAYGKSLEETASCTRSALCSGCGRLRWSARRCVCRSRKSGAGAGLGG